VEQPASALNQLMNASRLRDICTSAMALFVALWLSGGQTMVLQVTAWSGMIVTRTIESGVKDALATTFDGKHPCALCTAIKDVQQDKQDPKAPAPLKTVGKLKIDASLALHASALVPYDVVAEITWPDMILVGASCDLDPPVPPPRLLA